SPNSVRATWRGTGRGGTTPVRAAERRAVPAEETACRVMGQGSSRGGRAAAARVASVRCRGGAGSSIRCGRTSLGGGGPDLGAAGRDAGGAAAAPGRGGR